jgi:hypothetical protein
LESGPTKTLTFRKIESVAIGLGTNTSPGVTQGVLDVLGKIYIETDGTMSLIGWDALNSTVNNKADKVQGAVNGNLAGLDANGNLTDSGKKAADFVSTADIDTAEPTASSIDTKITSAKRLWTMLGAGLASLQTTAKTVIGAINELFDTSSRTIAWISEHLWQPGTEYALGNGLFGQVFSGLTAETANLTSDLGSIPDFTKIISITGFVQTDTATIPTSGYFDLAINASIVGVFIKSDGTISAQWASGSSDYSEIPITVYVKYTK